MAFLCRLRTGAALLFNVVGLSVVACERHAPASSAATFTGAPATAPSSSIQSASSRPAAWAVPLERPGLPNCFQVSDKLYRGAQPSPEGWAELKKLGVKTVVNLRRFHSDREECAAAGVDYVEIDQNAWRAEDQDVIEFLRQATDPARQPVFVHCQHGADRTGMAVATYRIVVQGWSKDQAIEEMTTGGYGFSPLWRNLIAYVRNLDVEAMRRRISAPRP